MPQPESDGKTVLGRGLRLLTVSVADGVLRSVREDGITALSFTGRLPGDAEARRNAYVKRMIRSGWEVKIQENEEMGPDGHGGDRVLDD